MSIKVSNLPKFSIITPVFNGEKYISRTIESIISQKYKNYEFIIVDGGSTDGTHKILDFYKPFISKIIIEPDRGMYDAINKGIKYASGDIYSYINSDDYYFPDTLSRVAKVFNHSDCQFAFGNCLFIDSSEHEKFKYSGVMLSYANTLRLNRIPFAQQTTFWSSKLHELVGGFDVNFKYVADTKFFLDCLLLSKKNIFHLKGNPLACFRIHEDAISSRLAAVMKEEHDLIFRERTSPNYLSQLCFEVLVKLINLKNFMIRALK